MSDAMTVASAGSAGHPRDVSCPIEHPLEAVVHHDGLERRLVEDLAEDVLVVLEPAFVGLHAGPGP